VLGAQVGQPVPGEDALDSDDNIFSKRLDGLQELLWSGFDVPVKHNLSFEVLDTEVHGSGVQVDAAVVLVTVCEESHWVSFWWEWVVPLPAYPAGTSRGRLNEYQELPAVEAACHAPC